MTLRTSGDKPPWTIYALIPALIIPLSLPLATQYLWEPDSVNYALALERFSLQEHIPHPPGYLFFVLALRAVHTLVGDPNMSLILVSIAANILTASLLAWLATRMADRWVGLSTVLLLVFNHIFWYYGHLSTIYPVEGAAATAIACATYLSLRGERGWGVGSGLVLGLAGGFRGMIVPLLFPLWAFGLFSRTRRPTNWVLPLAAVALGMAAWLVPTCLLTGGLDVYRSESRQLFLYNLHLTSFLFADEPLIAFGKNFLALGVFSLMGLSYLGLVGLISFGLAPAARRWARELLRNRQRLAFFVLWTVPPVLFYLLTHIPKPGYLMTVLPGWQLLLGWMLVASWRRFFATGRTRLPVYLGILLGAHILVTVGIHFSLAQSFMIRPSNEHLEKQLAVARSSLCPKPEHCLILVHKVHWRQLYWYLPKYDVVALIDGEVAGLDDYGAEVGWAKGRKARYASGRVIWTRDPRPPVQQVPIPREAQVILWYVETSGSEFFEELRKALPLHGPLLHQGDFTDTVFHSARHEMNVPVKIGAFQFVDEDGPPPDERWWSRAP